MLAIMDLSSEHSITIQVTESDGTQRELFTPNSPESSADAICDILQDLGYQVQVR